MARVDGELGTFVGDGEEDGVLEFDPGIVAPKDELGRVGFVPSLQLSLRQKGERWRAHGC